MVMEEILKDGCFTYNYLYLECKNLSKFNPKKERTKSNCKK